MRSKSLYVTRPFMPPLDTFLPYLRKIWMSGQVTNGGVFHDRLEIALANYLQVEHLSLVANGTLALMAAIRALGLSGEVITTPFSFVATANALMWSGITPVFVDIDPDSLNLNPEAIAAAITPRTTALLPVHVYGRPCDPLAVQRIADAHGLKVLYDAAHSIGVRTSGLNVFEHGDLSALSFHATKVFHTFEGGAVICRDGAMKQQVDLLKNHGIESETSLATIGINAKMNEIQAAFGLLQLEYLDNVIDMRQAVDARYRQSLADVGGISCLPLPEVARYNYGYFPIFVDDGFPLRRDDLWAAHRASPCPSGRATGLAAGCGRSLQPLRRFPLPDPPHRGQLRQLRAARVGLFPLPVVDRLCAHPQEPPEIGSGEPEAVALRAQPLRGESHALVGRLGRDRRWRARNPAREQGNLAFELCDLALQHRNFLALLGAGSPGRIDLAATFLARKPGDFFPEHGSDVGHAAPR